MAAPTAEVTALTAVMTVPLEGMTAGQHQPLSGTQSAAPPAELRPPVGNLLTMAPAMETSMACNQRLFQAHSLPPQSQQSQHLFSASIHEPPAETAESVMGKLWVSARQKFIGDKAEGEKGLY